MKNNAIIIGLLQVAETLDENVGEIDHLADNWEDYCHGDMREIFDKQYNFDVAMIPESVWKVDENDRPPIYHQLKSIRFILELTKQLRKQKK